MRTASFLLQLYAACMILSIVSALKDMTENNEVEGYYVRKLKKTLDKEGSLETKRGLGEMFAMGGMGCAVWK